MMKAMNWLGMIATILATGAIAQPVCAVNVEDFESYANTAALAGKWQDSVGSPVQTLDTSVFHSGAKSMKLEYNCGVNPFENQLTYSFASNQNWSGFDHFNLWVRSVDNATSLEHLTFQLKDEFGGTLGSSQISTQVGNAWTQWSVNLSGFSNLAGVRQISLDVSAFDTTNGFGAGTLYFDDMSVVAAVPEASTLGMMLFGALGMIVAMKRRGQKLN